MENELNELPQIKHKLIKEVFGLFSMFSFFFFFFGIIFLVISNILFGDLLDGRNLGVFLEGYHGFLMFLWAPIFISAIFTVPFAIVGVFISWPKNDYAKILSRKKILITILVAIIYAFIIIALAAQKNIASYNDIKASEARWAEERNNTPVHEEVDMQKVFEEANIKCVDSDGGKDYYVRGNASILNIPVVVTYIPSMKMYKGSIYGENSNEASAPTVDDNSTSITLYDHCVKTGENVRVAEAYCNEKEEPQYEYFNCPNGCKDGVCIK